jgi:hypothetical protein
VMIGQNEGAGHSASGRPAECAVTGDYLLAAVVGRATAA